MAFSGFEEKWDALKKTREQQVAEALKYLECLQRLEVVCNLGSGTYGDVVKVRSRTTGETKAAKIATMDTFCQNEVDLWPQLHHRNIVPVETIVYTITNTTVILMPLYFNSWKGCLENALFRKHPMAIACTKRWTYDLLKALDYLHSNLFCHLDLKLDNVLIDFDGSAVVCDFSALNKASYIQAGQATLPSRYRPPEAFHEKIINGQAFDLWACGTLILQAFTGCAMYQIKKAENFEEDIFPVLKSIFEPGFFLVQTSLVYKAFAANEKWVQEARHFIQKFMQFEPLMRATPAEAMVDPFLFGAGDINPDIHHIFGIETGKGDNSLRDPVELPVCEMEKQQSVIDKASSNTADSHREDGSHSINIQDGVMEKDPFPDIQQPEIIVMEREVQHNGVRKKKSARHWLQKKWRKVTNFFRSSKQYEKLQEDEVV